jgi:phosphoribosylaminoimidazole (AIR) synthetase
MAVEGRALVVGEGCLGDCLGIRNRERSIREKLKEVTNTIIKQQECWNFTGPEMARTFNTKFEMITVVGQAYLEQVQEELTAAGEETFHWKAY